MKKLSQAIQSKINQSQNYEKIIILYGLCGGALLSISTSHVPLVIVRVHDCMSILLGSKKKYNEFVSKNKLLNWSCYSLKRSNYINDCLSKWMDEYDPETIDYLKSILILKDNIYVSLNLAAEKEYIKTEKIINEELNFLKEILILSSNEIVYVYPDNKIYQTGDDLVIDISKQ